MNRLQELAARRALLQLEAETQRRALRRQVNALDARTRPLQLAWRFARTALRAWVLWRRWRARR